MMNREKNKQKLKKEDMKHSDINENWKKTYWDTLDKVTE